MYVHTYVLYCITVQHTRTSTLLEELKLTQTESLHISPCAYTYKYSMAHVLERILSEKC